MAFGNHWNYIWSYQPKTKARKQQKKKMKDDAARMSRRKRKQVELTEDNQNVVLKTGKWGF